MKTNDEDNSLTLVQLPVDVLLIMMAFLGQRDVANLSLICKHFKWINEIAQSERPFINAINKEILSLGYHLPHYSKAFIGIFEIEDQINFLSLLRKHAGIRETFDIIGKLGRQDQEMVSDNLRTTIGNALSNIEKILKMPMLIQDVDNKTKDDELKVQYLEQCIRNRENKQLNLSSIYNPILLRIYIEILRISALISSSSSISSYLYKKLFLASFLLLNLGDPTCFFCLVDIASKSERQNKKELMDYIKKHFGFTGRNEDFLHKLEVEAFSANGINFNKQEIESLQKSFLSRFNYTLAFFYPRTTLLLLNRLIKNFDSKGLIIFANISPGIFQCFESHFELFFNKIMTDKVVDNLKIIDSYFTTQKKEQAQATLLALVRNVSLFNHLSLEEILQIPYAIIPILRNSSVKDFLHWNIDFANFLIGKLDKLRQVSAVFKYWPLQDIQFFLGTTDEKMFSIIASCPHRHSLFATLTLQDLHFLFNNNHRNDKSLLELFCERDNFLILSVLLSKTKEIKHVAQKIENNETLKKMLRTKNNNFLLSKVPRYYQQLRAEKINFDSSLPLMLDIISNKDFFQLVLDLSGGHLFFVEKNIHIINLLKNPLVFKYVSKWNLSLKTIEDNINMFRILSIQGKEASHIYLLSLSFQELASLYRESLLTKILSVTSETLFAWLLFDKVVRPQFYYNIISSDELTIRSMDQIKQLLAGAIITNLDSFGFSLHDRFRSEFRHCDVELTRYFTVSQLQKFHAMAFDNLSFLQYLCSINPCVVIIAINYAKKDKKHINMGAFTQFFQLPFWKFLNSSFAWMALLYFDLNDLTTLASWTVNGYNVLNLLTSETNKQLFNLLINHCKVSEEFLPDRPLFKIQNPPTLNKLNLLKFNNLLAAICSSGFIFIVDKCIALLKKFTADEVIHFYNNFVDNENQFTQLHLIASIAQEPVFFESFLSQANNFSEAERLLNNWMFVTQKNVKHHLTQTSEFKLDSQNQLTQKRVVENENRKQPQKYRKNEQGEESITTPFNI